MIYFVNKHGFGELMSTYAHALFSCAWTCNGMRGGVVVSVFAVMKQVLIVL